MTEQKLAVVGVQSSQDSTMGFSAVTETVKCLIDIKEILKGGEVNKEGKGKGEDGNWIR